MEKYNELVTYKTEQHFIDLIKNCKKTIECRKIDDKFMKIITSGEQKFILESKEEKLLVTFISLHIKPSNINIIEDIDYYENYHGRSFSYKRSTNEWMWENSDFLYNYFQNENWVIMFKIFSWKNLDTNLSNKQNYLEELDFKSTIFN